MSPACIRPLRSSICSQLLVGCTGAKKIRAQTYLEQFCKAIHCVNDLVVFAVSVPGVSMADSIFLVYLRFAQNMISLLCKTVTAITLSRLIYLSIAQKFRIKCNLSNTLRVFIWCHLLNSIYSYTYHLYCVAAFSGLEAR